MTSLTHRDGEVSVSGSSEDGDFLDLADDEGWEDLEPDVEIVKVVCLMCNTVFDGVKPMVQHCKHTHGLDIVDIQKKFNLEFLGLMRLVNYIRSEVEVGNTAPNLSNESAFQDEKYLLPVLEDDPLLYSLHDAIGEDFDDIDDSLPLVAGKTLVNHTQDTKPIIDLERKLQRAQLELDACRRELEELRSQAKFHDNHVLPMKTIPEVTGHVDIDAMSLGEKQSKTRGISDAVDSSYFASYSGHDIHATMLKDTVRTDAYRDFIYDNKHIFAGKTVLDVGCGTGILSMFCARAGAAKVIAVDNSDIINFAREHVYKNGMGETITCLRGKIEEVILPVPMVDIIVSEWMGYCLLYEAMLDSVLWARDHYLKPDGLMVPSQCTLRIAPMSDPEYIDEHIHHWRNVYGFDMSGMSHDMYDDAMVQQVPPKALAADSAPFLQLPLKTLRINELIFAGKPFSFKLKMDIDSLDGFVVWFDTFFLATPNGQMNADVKAEDLVRNDGELIAFTTGPHGKDTHWHQGVLMINHHGKQPEALKKGHIVHGIVGYDKRKDDGRALDISVSWELEGVKTKGKQSWSMR